jgi:hypothetical protein
MSGSMERTRSMGMLSLTRRPFDDPLPRRYAMAMCPTANKRFSPLDSDISDGLTIKHIG